MQVHGQYDIRHQGRLLVVDARGPWNDEAARQYRSELEQAVAELSASDWAKIVIFHGQAILTPEAEQALIEITRWRMANGMRRIAIVLDEVENPGLVRAQFDEVYTTVGIEYAFFEGPDAAFGWMAEAGYVDCRGG